MADVDTIVNSWHGLRRMLRTVDDVFGCCCREGLCSCHGRRRLGLLLTLILLPRVLARQARGCRGTARLATALAVAAVRSCVLVTDDDGLVSC
jgi:hypothetical protein